MDDKPCPQTALPIVLRESSTKYPKGGRQAPESPARPVAVVWVHGTRIDQRCRPGDRQQGAVRVLSHSIDCLQSLPPIERRRSAGAVPDPPPLFPLPPPPPTCVPSLAPPLSPPPLPLSCPNVTRHRWVTRVLLKRRGIEEDSRTLWYIYRLHAHR